MPRHESGDRAPCSPRTTPQHQLTPATTSDSATASCSDYTLAHETKEEKRKKGQKVPKRERENKDSLETSAK